MHPIERSAMILEHPRDKVSLWGLVIRAWILTCENSFIRIPVSLPNFSGATSGRLSTTAARRVY